MVGAKRPGIFPLRIDDFVSLANRDPAIFANGDGGALVSVFEPRNYMRRLRSVAGGSFIVVGQGAIKWILPRREFHRRIILPARRIIFARFFSDPENGRYDLAPPRIRFAR